MDFKEFLRAFLEYGTLLGRQGQGNMLHPSISFGAPGYPVEGEERKWELEVGYKNEIASGVILWQWSNGMYQAETREIHPKLELLLTTGFDLITTSMNTFQINNKYHCLPWETKWWNDWKWWRSTPSNQDLANAYQISFMFTPASNSGPTGKSQMHLQTSYTKYISPF